MPEGLPVGPADCVEFCVGNGGEPLLVGFLVELQTPEDIDPVPPGGPLLDGPVGQDVVVFETGNGGELCVAVDDVPTPVPDLVLVTGPVPVGPVLAAVELGNGYDAVLDKVADGPGSPVLQLDEGAKVPVPVPVPVPPVPVGAELLEFEIGYGALLVEMPGAVPVPCVPELAGTEVPTEVGPWVLVRFVVGYGAELQEGVGMVELAGAVPDVG